MNPNLTSFQWHEVSDPRSNKIVPSLVGLIVQAVFVSLILMFLSPFSFFFKFQHLQNRGKILGFGIFLIGFLILDLEWEEAEHRFELIDAK